MATKIRRRDRQGAVSDGVFDVAGNSITLLAEGPERLTALLDLIAGARSSLRLLYYIYRDDDVGRQVLQALVDALGRGVSVALIVDGFGSDATEAFFRPLEQAGANICRFLPRFGRRYLLRNHQKLALADERRVIVGGFNVEKDYFGLVSDHAWRDLGLIVEGPAAARLASYFDALSDWVHRPRARLRDLRYVLKAHSEREGAVRWLFGGPTRWLSPWALAVKQDLARAMRLDMVVAYFAPNPAMLRRIERIARRDGEARLLTAAQSDNGATIAAARHTYHRLLKRGVRIFEYLPTKLHTKLFVIDDRVHVGSANFDVRSLYLNLELMLCVEDPAFARRMRDYVEGELARSVEITRESHRRASNLIARIKWAIAYFIVAVLDGNITRRLNFEAEGR
ncbi:cardiolipin synthetase [Sphingomonas oleivorans]|uniref:Phospholipase D n=1 Tax=Sphingomonas oleivorans TaxID=1735121 RepID=A0A2T5FX59_9SPHN|nr:phosphatidylserine/phosphatidylglycerophosphate/cardiolipin synthase family protein [Sphingomonas oleivorans]PTQ10716.1 cardiolipin synthetase [Sphingomonas oleivorans]